MGQTNIPIGAWREHFSFNNVRQVVDAGDKTYASASNGLFVIDREDNSVTVISTLDGLQEQNITAIAFNITSNQLLIGYASGNLDILENNQIFNIDLTTTSQVNDSKTINDIVFREESAFLITDFGAIKFDLLQRQVSETYRELSQNFETLRVNEAAIYNDSIFLASEEGVLAADIRGDVNLLDPNNWVRFSANDSIPQSDFQVISSTTQGVVVGSQEEGLYFYNDVWTNLNLFTNTQLNSLTSLENELLLVSDSAVFRSSSDLEFEEISLPLITTPNDAIFDNNEKLWIADRIRGVITNLSGAFESITPSGPFGNKIFRFRFFDQSLFSLPGGFNERVRPLNCDLGYYSFTNGIWENFNAFNNALPDFNDITGVVNLPQAGSMLFSSAQDGLLELRPDGDFSIINHLTTGSPLENTGVIEDEIIIPALLGTTEGTWMLNYSASLPLHLLLPDNTWRSFALPSRLVIDLVEVGSTLWILPEPESVGGIIVFDKETGNTRFLNNISGNGGLTGREVRSAALDLEGLMWVGTEDGVSVFTNPFNVLTGQVDAIEPIFDSRLLLRGEEVTVIEVDGGNQKWIGTRNGVWLFDDQADQQIFNFNTDNSPLPSNNILDIGINPQSGEVFFATDAGIVSFRGDATNSTPVHEEVSIFPNPVTRNFVGNVGISGLATDAIIKITDVSGKLIFETQANGGTATWDVNNYNGKRASSGVYLVFSASSDGEETFVGKIAIVE